MERDSREGHWKSLSTLKFWLMIIPLMTKAVTITVSIYWEFNIRQAVFSEVHIHNLL